jgi:hypothetical protein
VEGGEEGGGVGNKVKFENLMKGEKLGKWTNLPT